MFRCQAGARIQPGCRYRRGHRAIRIATLTALVVVILPTLPRVALGDEKLAERFLQRQVRRRLSHPPRRWRSASPVRPRVCCALRTCGPYQQPVGKPACPQSCRRGSSLSPKDAKRLQRIARAARNRAFWASQPDLISMQVQYGMAADAWFQRVATPHY